MKTPLTHHTVAAAAILGAAGLMLAASGCAHTVTTAPTTTAATTTATVGMTNTLKFTPQTITVHVGDTVVWKNGSDLTHTVTDVPKLASKAGDATLPKGAKSFNSGYINPGKSYSHTFTVPGTYHYFCIPHEALGMTGVVIVKP
ncbi:MAG: cupredoxin domain-containing protein [Gammaproteobacteria bacterium]